MLSENSFQDKDPSDSRDNLNHLIFILYIFSFVSLTDCSYGVRFEPELMLYWKYFLYGQTNRITLVDPLQIEYALGFAKNVFVPVSLGG